MINLSDKEVETIDNFLDKILSEELKNNQKKSLSPFLNISLTKRAKLLLNNSEITKQEAEYFSYIEKHCSDFVDIIKKIKKFLYRGASFHGDAFEFKPSSNRHPTDTPLLYHNIINSYLNVLGFKATRSNSAFVTNSLSLSKKFGSSFIVFPKNGYHYLWSELHRDWVIDEKDFKSVNNETNDKLFFSNYYHIWDMIRESFFSIKQLKYSLLTIIKDENLVIKNNFHFFEKISFDPKKVKNLKLEKHEEEKVIDIINSFNLNNLQKVIDLLVIANKKIPNIDKVNNYQGIEITINNIVPIINTFISFINWLNGINSLDDKKLINNLIKKGDLNKSLSFMKRSINYYKTYPKLENDNLKKVALNFVKKHKMISDKDIDKAILSGNEIQINGELILLKTDEFLKSAKKYFFD